MKIPLKVMDDSFEILFDVSFEILINVSFEILFNVNQPKRPSVFELQNSM